MLIPVLKYTLLGTLQTFVDFSISYKKNEIYKLNWFINLYVTDNIKQWKLHLRTHLQIPIRLFFFKFRWYVLMTEVTVYQTQKLDSEETLNSFHGLNSWSFISSLVIYFKTYDDNCDFSKHFRVVWPWIFAEKDVFWPQISPQNLSLVISS